MAPLINKIKQYYYGKHLLFLFIYLFIVMLFFKCNVTFTKCTILALSPDTSISDMWRKAIITKGSNSFYRNGSVSVGLCGCHARSFIEVCDEWRWRGLWKWSTTNWLHPSSVINSISWSLAVTFICSLFCFQAVLIVRLCCITFLGGWKGLKSKCTQMWKSCHHRFA